jgi:hypothetical protein
MARYQQVQRDPSDSRPSGPTFPSGLAPRRRLMARRRPAGTQEKVRPPAHRARRRGAARSRRPGSGRRRLLAPAGRGGGRYAGLRLFATPAPGQGWPRRPVRRLRPSGCEQTVGRTRDTLIPIITPYAGTWRRGDTGTWGHGGGETRSGGRRPWLGASGSRVRTRTSKDRGREGSGADFAGLFAGGASPWPPFKVEPSSIGRRDARLAVSNPRWPGSFAGGALTPGVSQSGALTLALPQRETGLRSWP